MDAEQHELIKRFLGMSYVPTEASCPLCGCSVVGGATGELYILHITWHERIDALATAHER